MKYLTIILLFSSCSASWHIRQAQRKDPSLFRVPNPVTTTIKTDPFNFQFNCDSFYLKPVEIIYPRKYTDSKGVERTDTSKVTFTPRFPKDTTLTPQLFDVELKPADPIIEYVSYPVYLEPGMKFKGRWALIGAGLLAFLIGLGLTIKNIFK